MFARLSVYENVDLALAAELQRWIESLDSDPFVDLPGYRGSMTLLDRDNARLVGIGFYASGGHAQEAETLLGDLYQESRPHMPESLRSAVDMQPESVGVYEIVHRD